ncbi:DUF1156 domain-containing protein [Nocardia sp. NPDC050799]|uniref:DUF1156 domain-containing protein n=1 Tax=Nocardia sp. NPDC050799 TaxID=3154842 RepID=UPI0033EA41D3
MTRRKLIEVALPLEAINKEAAREKSIRHGHPSTLHLWWARRPLAAARAVLFAQLVDDPASRPEAEAIEDPDDREHWIRAERSRLFRMIEDLVKWENTTDERLLKAAHDEILRSTDGNPPPIVDPFAGGGTIPLEAQRLGLEAHASDLNPVAVLINKALIEIPPKFAGNAPVFPDAAESKLGNWPNATGLAEDVRRYGQWMRDEAEKRIGHLYPKATLADGAEATVIAWIWARTVMCPNPACAIEMPLVRSWWLGKKKGKEAYVVPEVVDGPHGKCVQFRIGCDPKRGPAKDQDGTVGRNGATCVSCGTAIPLEYVREQSRNAGLGSRMMATVAEGDRRRVYLSPTEVQTAAAWVSMPQSVPAGDLFDWPGRINVVRYGLTKFADLFTNRQLVALTTFSDLVSEAREKVLADAELAGMSVGERLVNRGTGAAAYADAVATYLGFGISKAADYQNSLCAWRSDPKNEGVGHLFARQAIPMIWDYCEANPLSSSSGNIRDQYTWVSKVIERLPAAASASASQSDASSRDFKRVLISTDPPYYDNIGYSDLSDFFYVWLRRSLEGIFPSTLGTMLVPKAEELVANPYRHDGRDGAKEFFEKGFQRVFANARNSAYENYPIAVYYAFKQTETDSEGSASTGWETLLEGMIRSGWAITGTWPMRSELGNRILSRGTNALASSIVLALRPRSETAPSTERRTFLNELRDELPEKLRELQQGSIAPVDMAQAAIGPGMAVFSRYSDVIEPDGSSMSVRKALSLINQVLAEVLSEQEGDFDAATRWCLKWFETHGFNEAPYGEAEQLSVSMNTSVASLARSGAIRSGQSRVTLIHPDDLPDNYDPQRDNDINLWEVVCHMAKSLDTVGIDDTARIMAGAVDRVDLDSAKGLAYLAYSIAERKNWSQIAQLFNALVTTWADIAAVAREHQGGVPEQGQLGLDELY